MLTTYAVCADITKSYSSSMNFFSICLHFCYIHFYDQIFTMHAISSSSCHCHVSRCNLFLLQRFVVEFRFYCIPSTKIIWAKWIFFMGKETKNRNLTKKFVVRRRWLWSIQSIMMNHKITRISSALKWYWCKRWLVAKLCTSVLLFFFYKINRAKIIATHEMWVNVSLKKKKEKIITKSSTTFSLQFNYAFCMCFK